MHFNYLEMKYLVLCVTLNILFFANTVSTTVTIVAVYDDVGTHTKKFDIHQPLQLTCNVTTDGVDAKQVVDVTWEKNQQPISKADDLKKRASISHKDGVFKFQLSSAAEEDAGEYACVASIAGEEKARAIITVQSKVYVKIPRDISVIEGDALKVICQVHGNPLPDIEWIYQNKTYKSSEGRVKIEADNSDENKIVSNAVFILSDVTIADQGDLICKGVSKLTNELSEPSKGVVRVKDKYAALWPFLGICAEVLILCAIILIYEKKRNKTELDESDTDQSPEQKNTPDHGGKESNLRHRQ